MTVTRRRSLQVACAALAASSARLRAADETGAASSESIDRLPVLRELPDPFKTLSGRRVRTPEEWPARRSEILAQVLQYEYGTIPDDPGEGKATEGESGRDDATGATVRHLTVAMGPKGAVSTHVILTIPAGAGPFPVIVKGDLCWGRVRPEIIADVIRRGYILAEFDRTEIAPDRAGRDVGIYPHYPNHTWGALAAWAWGYGRVIDALVQRPEIDRSKIVVTGHSRGGKATLLAGAIDSRVAITVPNGSGCGGGGCFRVIWPNTEDLQSIVTHFPYWFASDFNRFIGHVDQLPFDQHEVRALVAPRALLTTDSLGDMWANPLGTEVSWLASKPVFDFLNAGDKTGFHFRHGKHEQNAEDFAALLDFADFQFRGVRPAQSFDQLPFPQIPKAFSWTLPSGKEG